LNEIDDEIGQIEVHYTYSNELEYNAIKSIISPFKFVLNGDEDEDTLNVIRALLLFAVEGRRSDLISIVSSSINKEDETPVEFDETNNVERKRPSKYVTSFIHEIDEFPFMNIGTEFSPGGNCAGIARITAKVFRGDEIEMELEENIGGTDFSYNLYGCDELETLQDKGLSDYKYMGYWEDTYEDTAYLPLYSYSDDDRTFIEYLGYNLYKENSQPDTVYTFGQELTFEDFSKILDWFENNDEILTLSGSNINGGHAVNCYGVEQSDRVPEIYYLLIYDNNAPCGEVFLNDHYYTADVICRATVRHHLFKEDTVDVNFEFRIGDKLFYEYGTNYKLVNPSNKDAVGIIGSSIGARTFTVRTVDGDIIF
ncbi:MAG: hypothetical protein IJ593_10385, partial [Lachnospiraceae bacterium]|nr:hypothetical protein [Lachnospiraceae bacterium]